MKASHLLVLQSLLTASLLGCGHDEPAKSPDNAPPATTAASTPTSVSPDTTGSPTNAMASGNASGATSTAGATPMASATASSGATQTDATPALNDDQILQVTHTANQGEIEQAKLAQTKAKDARVKKLAAMMLKDHSDADSKGTALAKKDGINPSPSPASTSLESDAQSATSTLKSQSGADFDRNYVDTQVKEHQSVLDTLDQKLIPNAKNADVKAYLTEVRSKVAMHLQHAQDLQKELQR